MTMTTTITTTRRSIRRRPAALVRFPDLVAEAEHLSLDELVTRLNVASYANLSAKPKADREEMVLFEIAITKLVIPEARPLTVRRVFYLAVSAKIVNKTEQEAERVQEAVLRLRRDNFIPYPKIIDETRDVVLPVMFTDERDFFPKAIRWWFRTDPWAKADEIVLVFSEKRGMSPILSEITDDYGVPLYPMAGYTSETALWEAGERIKKIGKSAHVFQVGDRDNSGLDMADEAMDRLRRMVAPLPVTFERIAVLEEHIAAYGLPTRPQKEDKRGDVEAVEDAVEIDAMDPDIVQDLLRLALRRHMPDERLAVHAAGDEARRHKMLRFIGEYRPWRRAR